MVYIIEANSVSWALSQGLEYLDTEGIEENSRNGKVLVAPGPVVTVYSAPCHRVLFSQLRDANPFFHLMEALWMLGGRNDLAFPEFFNGRFAEYSDDGETIHGAYGYRWRKWFDVDQVGILLEELKKNPETRRAVLTMWAPQGDLVKTTPYGGPGGKDVPCNTGAYFDARGGRLNMTVTCRSNDIWWGAYGANAVHFSVLQEYMAGHLEIPVGEYRQFSNNYHLYLDVVPREKIPELAAEVDASDLYGTELEPTPLIKPSEAFAWNVDLETFLGSPCHNPEAFQTEFFRETVSPMYCAWATRKNRAGDGLDYAKSIAAPDWQVACTEWILRRTLKQEVRV